MAQQRLVLLGLLGLLALLGWSWWRVKRSEARMQATLAALRQSEQRYRGILEHQTEFILRIKADGEVLYVNDAFCSYFGVQRHDIIGHSWHPVALPEDVPMVEERLQTLSAERPLVTIENRVLAQGGVVRWCQFDNRALCDDTGRIVEIQTVGRDINQRKQLELALAASAAEYRDLYDHAPCGYHSLDPQGRYLRINATELRWLGCERIELIGKLGPTDFYTDEGKAEFQRSFPVMLAQGHIENLEFDLLPRRGPRRRVSVSATTVRDERGQVLMSRSVMYDITDLQQEKSRRAEAERHLLARDALLQERTDMLYLLAHEVRQPLNTASVVMQRAEADLRSAGQAEHAGGLFSAQTVMRQVLASVDNTLAVAALLSGTEPLERIDADLDTLFALTLTDLPEAQRHRVRVERHTTTRTAAMDPSLMRLALRNLLDNALRYSPAEQPVVITVADSDEPLALLIDVTDHGPGLPANVLQHLFERGIRGRRSHRDGPELRHGHGLGLFIVHRVMTLHGGSVQLLHNGPDGVTLRLVLDQAHDLGD